MTVFIDEEGQMKLLVAKEQVGKNICLVVYRNVTYTVLCVPYFANYQSENFFVFFSLAASILKMLTFKGLIRVLVEKKARSKNVLDCSEKVGLLNR